MEQQNNNTAQNSNLDDDEISLIELGTALGKEKKLIFGLPFITGVITIVITLLMTPIFTAKTTLLPPQSKGAGASALLGQLGGLGALAGLDMGGGAGSPDMFVEMLKSASAKDKIIEKFDLMNRYEAEFKVQAYAILDERVSISTDKKSGLISLSVDDEDPAFAAEMANYYYQVLKELLSRVAVTEAQQKRLFFEEQFAKARDDLANAEIQLKEVQEKTGLIQLEGQAKATFDVLAQLQAEVTRREAQLAAMQTYATPSNPEYRRIANELASLKAQLSETEKKSGTTADDTGAFSRANLPERGLEYLRAFRNFKYNEAIYEIMAKQFELAKVEEAKDTSNLQQLDIATAPELKSKPKRAIIVIVAVFVAGFLAVLIALFKQAFKNTSRNPDELERIKEFRKAWTFR